VSATILQKEKHFVSLKGILEINTDGYAIEHVTATPSDTSLATVFAIEQRYKVDSVHWFLDAGCGNRLQEICL
jgi:hypothetical protein